MKTDFVNSLSFENVKILKGGESGSITFSIQEISYMISFHKGRNWFASHLFHDTSKNFDCPFCYCSTSDVLCYYLELYLDEIFQKLKEHPSVRLELIFA
jgi:hypothetical protein